VKSVIFVTVLLSVAFFTGLYLTLFYPRHIAKTQTPITREFTLEGLTTVPTGTIVATILGSISIGGDIPVGSTINVEARETGTKQFSTILQNLPAKSNQTFSYIKATNGARYDMKVTLLNTSSKVIGTSQILTVSAPSLNVQFKVNPTVPLEIATPSSILVSPTPTSITNPSPTASVSATLSGNISFHGAAPMNSRVVILQELANASPYQIAVDNLIPIDGTMWHWDHPIGGNSYSVIAVLKQKQSNGTDTDIATSAPATVTAPAASIVLTVNSYFTLTKPTGTSNVNCVTYDGGPNQNKWNVTVNFPSFTGAGSYWLEIGTTDGGNDIVNTSGNMLTASTIFKNNTTYYARYAYATVSNVDTGSGQYSAFSDTTRLICSHP
jgi:hypothetical protein